MSYPSQLRVFSGHKLSQVLNVHLVVCTAVHLVVHLANCIVLCIHRWCSMDISALSQGDASWVTAQSQSQSEVLTLLLNLNTYH